MTLKQCHLNSHAGSADQGQCSASQHQHHASPSLLDEDITANDSFLASLCCLPPKSSEADKYPKPWHLVAYQITSKKEKVVCNHNHSASLITCSKQMHEHSVGLMQKGIPFLSTVQQNWHSHSLIPLTNRKIIRSAFIITNNELLHCMD